MRAMAAADASSPLGGEQDRARLHRDPLIEHLPGADIERLADRVDQRRLGGDEGAALAPAQGDEVAALDQRGQRLAQGRAGDAQLLGECDLVTPNETEFALLLERIAGERVAAATLVERPNSELHALARTLGVPTVIVTLGAEGCFVSHDERSDKRGDAKSFYRVRAEKVNAVDSTGAGDAFSGALAAAMLRFRDKPFLDAVMHANRVAAISTETVGTAPAMPTFGAVARRFAR